MSYKVIVISAVSAWSTNFSKAAKKMEEEVNADLKNGWEPLGGISVGRTMSSQEPHLFQAMIKRDKNKDNYDLY